MQAKNDTGGKGELWAKNYLLDNGFVIRHTNWRFGHKEVDIVAEKPGVLHIVEVKTRAANYLEEPKKAVIRQKQKNMLAAAEAYIAKYNLNCDTQFDVISIVISNNGYELEYIPSAFIPSEIL